MSIKKRRGGYLATAEGVKKLKEAKRVKKYTYQQIAEAARETEDKVKRLFNPQWGDGKYKVGEEAVQEICNVLDVKPEEIVSDWYPMDFLQKSGEEEKGKGEKNKQKHDQQNTFEVDEVSISTQVKKYDLSYYEALEKIEKAAKDEVRELDLAGMELTELPAEIGKLTKLQTLILGKFDREKFEYVGNYLSSLPSEIVQLKNLTHLYIDKNILRNLPPEIVKLSKLTRLSLRNNSLKSLPPEIGNLVNLTHLYLKSNSLESLPSEIGQLENLKVLDLEYNFLDSLPPELGKLSQLRVLYLEKNSLHSLPSELGKLSQLVLLDLKNNSLNSLNPKIFNLLNLRELSLANNFLSSFPSEIEQLSHLGRLSLANNSLPIPPEIIEKSDEPATIINYYLYQLKNRKKQIHEAKLLLVGQGNVGKTSLKERLIRNYYDPTRNKTNGIDIENWKIKIDDKELQVNIWDFGGQEIMHSTHQFFLTKRSLYVLVLDTTQSEEENRIEYWLKIIQSFGKDAPVIIVGNKADQHPLDIDRRGLQKKYPQIKAFYEVSCETSKGIDELAEFVRQEINQLEHIDDVLPLPWFNIKEKLEDLALNKDYIPYEQYESLCEQEEVNKEDNQRILIRLLNDLGIVLNFQDDPRLEDTHVLNPEWVTNGVYKILNDRNLIVEDRGILTIQTLKRILDKKRYPVRKHLFIIGMMRKFELCFDIESDKQFLIPDILPKEEPYTGEWDNTLAFEYHYPVLPGSIISRFIVRMNHYIYQTTYWRSGVVLEHEGNLALVKADREDKIIKIRVNGKANTRRNLLTAIRSQFDYIHKTIPGIVPIAKVPLIEHPEIILDYQDLLDLESMGEKDVIVPKLKQRISLRQLLDGIEEPQNRGNKRFRDKDIL